MPDKVLIEKDMNKSEEYNLIMAGMTNQQQQGWEEIADAHRPLLYKPAE